MRRIVLATLALALVPAAPAGAEHHFMRVSEVYPAAAAADQFIELQDPVSEPFPSAQYSVAATDAAGAVIAGASQVLTEPPPFPFRNSTAPFVLGGSNVASKHRDLGFTIPAQAARVCFYDGGSPPAGLINCLDYGDVTIPAGQSAQRQSCGAVAAAAPTPGAANTQTGACPGGGGFIPGGGGPGGDTGGGGTGGGGSGGDGSDGGAEDLTPPQQQVGAKKRQDVDRLAVTVTLSEAGRVTAKGSVNVRGAARLFRFKPVTRTAAANTPVKLRLKLGRAARRSVKAALRGGRRIKARISIAARDGAGNPSSAKRTIRLTD